MKPEPKRIVLFIVIIALLIGFFVAYVKNTADKIDYVEIYAADNKILVNVEIADDSQEWAQGLMFRKNLDENSGMLFIFPDEQTRGFWMKNTLIPLDIIFVSSNLTIIDIKENFGPCETDPCQVYTSKAPAKYVLEVNGGFVEKKGIKVGDRIKIL